MLVAVFVCTLSFKCFFGSVQSRICMFWGLYLLVYFVFVFSWKLDFETNIQCFYRHVSRFIDFFIVALFSFFFPKKKKTVYDVHMNACIPEINQSGREMWETWLGSDFGIPSWVFDFYLKHISRPISRTKGRWNITLPSFVESLLYLGGWFRPSG